jgi:uncharacterized HAD superfamily protein
MEKIVGIDIADTIIDVWPNLMKKAHYFNEDHSNNPKSNNKNLYLPEDIYNWSKEEKELFWSLYRDELSFSMPIKKGVKETLDLLKSLSIKIYFITAKSNQQYIELEKKIIKLLNDNSIPYDKVFTQVENKGLLCHEENISYLVDDSYTNCLCALKYKKVALLMNNSYNKDRQMLENMFRIHEFKEIKQYVLK